MVRDSGLGRAGDCGLGRAGVYRLVRTGDTGLGRAGDHLIITSWWPWTVYCPAQAGQLAVAGSSLASYWPNLSQGSL